MDDHILIDVIKSGQLDLEAAMIIYSVNLFLPEPPFSTRFLINSSGVAIAFGKAKKTLFPPGSDAISSRRRLKPPPDEV
jgi:hypothetical protein